MARWTMIRRLAREARARAIEQAGGTTTAAEVVAAGLTEAGLFAMPLPAGNPLLEGAVAKLDLTTDSVLYDADRSPHEQVSNQAHELGHRLLHGDAMLSEACAADDVADAAGDTALPESVAVYNPHQQREQEANIFAAEYLAPAAEVRELFIADTTHNTAWLADHFGVSPAAISAQLTAALLTPTLPSIPISPIAVSSSDLVSSLPRLQSPSLNPSQQAACEALPGPILVDAGPGTGKTATLTARVAYLVAEKNVPPQKILAVTFSNKAANEMRERLEQRLPQHVAGLTILTFHAFALEQLRRYHDRAGLPADFRVLDGVEAYLLLRDNISRLRLRDTWNIARPDMYLPEMLTHFSRAKDELADPARYTDLAAHMLDDATDDKAQAAARKAVEVGAAYALFQDVLEEAGAVDFGELIARAVRLLADNPDVAADVQRSYSHILVDEYQDMNRASSRLLQLVAGDGAGLWVVGDLRQAIYRFRGASPANISQFEHDFPRGRRMTLDTNYRSTRGLVELFSDAGSRMAGALPIRWQSVADDVTAEPMTFITAPDAAAEAEAIADHIAARAADGRPYRQQAILCVTHNQATTFAGALEAKNIPVCYIGSVLDQPDVQYLRCLLALACEREPGALIRIADQPPFAMPPADTLALLKAAATTKRSIRDLLHDAPILLSDAAKSAAAGLVALLDAGKGEAPRSFFARALFGEWGIARDVLRGGNAQRAAAVAHFVALAARFEARFYEIGTTGDLRRAFLDHVYLLQELGEDRQRADLDDWEGVRLMTIHASKGLEFPVVYLPNLAQGRFPSQGRASLIPLPPGLVPQPDSDGAQELFFVAITRAREELVLSRAEKYGTRDGKDSDVLRLIGRSIEPPPATDKKPAKSAKESETSLTAKRAVGEGSRGVGSLPLTPAALKTYEACPRQYYYRYVQDIHDAGGVGSAYQGFRQAVRDIFGWLRDARQAGLMPVAAEVAARLDALLAEKGVNNSIHAATYREKADQMIRWVGKTLSDVSPQTAPPANTVELDDMAVTLPVDLTYTDDDGATVLARYMLTAPKPDHRTEEWTTLARRAARKTGAKVALIYPGEEKIEDVTAAPRGEERRLDKYAQLAQRIAAGEFAPQRGDQCAGCAFYSFCPAGVENIDE